MGADELYFCAPLTSSNHVQAIFLNIMSQHKSLQGPRGLVVKRNVLKRFERIETLKKRGQWKEGDRVTGLRKTKPDA
jgi:small basic protein (TIGR04137 family)